MIELTEKQKMAQRQSLDLDAKVAMTKQRIKAWDEHHDGDWYLARSFGKDSDVLNHIIESMGLNPMKFFSNTGLEFPELISKSREADGVTVVRPKKTFDQVWREEGLPIGSKKVARQIRTLKRGPEGQENTYRLYNEGIHSQGHLAPSWKIADKWRVFVDSDIKTSEKCCDYLKKEPVARFEKEHGMKGRGMTAMMADEGGYRSGMTQCNVYEGKSARSNPMLFWTTEDVWEYIKRFNVDVNQVYYPRVYDGEGNMLACDKPQLDIQTVQEWIDSSGCNKIVDLVDGATYMKGEELFYQIPGEVRTGCMFCAFGVQLEKGINRFQRMSISHPRQHRLIMERMGIKKAMDMINVKVFYGE